jgi:hypothetical protein
MKNIDWTLLTTHGQVLFYIAANAEATIPTIAEALGLSKRRIGSVLRDLRQEDMVRATRLGRRNVYAVNGAARFRHPSLADVQLGQIFDLVVPRGARVFYAHEGAEEAPPEASAGSKRSPPTS